MILDYKNTRLPSTFCFFNLPGFYFAVRREGGSQLLLFQGAGRHPNAIPPKTLLWGWSGCPASTTPARPLPTEGAGPHLHLGDWTVSARAGYGGRSGRGTWGGRRPSRNRGGRATTSPPPPSSLPPGPRTPRLPPSNCLPGPAPAPGLGGVSGSQVVPGAGAGFPREPLRWEACPPFLLAWRRDLWRRAAGSPILRESGTSAEASFAWGGTCRARGAGRRFPCRRPPPPAGAPMLPKRRRAQVE